MAQCSKILSVIIGPTGVGKTEFALRRAQEWGCPIVNCDSRQIYRELPIGTAAPTKEDRQRVTHYFVGTHSLRENYSAGQYERDAVPLLMQLMEQSTHPDTPFAILTGGSMLYMQAVLYGLDQLPIVPIEVRQTIQQAYTERGLEWLQHEVQRVDPDYWQVVDRCNPQRLIHCLEISKVAGQPYSQLRLQSKTDGNVGEETGRCNARPWQVHITCLARPRSELYDRINRRVDAMIDQGLEEEVRSAYLPFVKRNEPIPNSLNTVGYREMIDYLNGICTFCEAVDAIKQHTRNYAKRQLTWFRNSL